MTEIKFMTRKEIIAGDEAKLPERLSRVPNECNVLSTPQDGPVTLRVERNIKRQET